MGWIHEIFLCTPARDGPFDVQLQRTRRKHWDEFGSHETMKDFAGRGNFS